MDIETDTGFSSLANKRSFVDAKRPLIKSPAITPGKRDAGQWPQAKPLEVNLRKLGLVATRAWVQTFEFCISEEVNQPLRAFVSSSVEWV